VAHQVSDVFTENLLRDRGYRLEIAQVSGDIVRGLVFEAPRLIATRESDEIVAEARRLVVRVDPWGLLRGRVSVHHLEIDSPRVRFGRQGIRNDLLAASKERSARAPVPRFHVSELLIRQGRVAVRQNDTAPFLVDDIDLDLRLDSHATGVVLDVRDLEARLPGRGLDVRHATGGISWAQDTLRVRDLLVQTPNSHVQANGWMHPQSLDMALQCQADSFALSELEPWMDLPVTGVARGPVDVQWIDEDLQVSGRWTGQYEGHEVDQMFVELSWADDTFDLRTALGLFDRTPVDLELRVDPAGEVRGIVHFTELDLQRLRGFEAWPSSKLRGRADFHSGQADSLHVVLKLDDGNVAGWPFDEVRGNVDYHQGDARVSAATVERAGTTVRVAGLFEDESLQLDFSARSPAVAAALQPLHLDNADGRVELQGSILGPLTSPHIDARGWLQNATWRDLWAGDAEFDVSAVVAGEHPGFELQVRARDFRYRDRRVERAQTTLEWWGDSVRIQRAQVSRADTMLAVAAIYHRSPRDWLGDRRPSHRIELETALMQVGLREIRVEEPATLWWTDEAVHVDSLRFVSRGGRLRLDGGFDIGRSRIDGRAEISDFDLEFLSSFAPWEHLADGRGTGWFEAHGDLDRTQVDARLRIVEGSWNSLPFDSLQIEVQSDAFSIELRNLELQTPFGELVAAGRLGYLPAMRRWVSATSGSRDAEALRAASLSGRIALSDLQLDRVWMARRPEAAEPQWLAQVTADVDVQGTVSSPRLLVQGGARGLTFPSLRTDSLAVAVAYENDSLRVRDFSMRVGDARLLGTGMIPVRFSLSSRPTLLRNRPLEAQLTLPRSSFAVVQRLVPMFEAVPQGVPLGEIEGRLGVSGTLEDPRFVGNMTAHGVGFTFAGMEEVYRDVNTVGTFEGNTLRLRDIRANIGKDGRVRGDGELRFGGLEVKDYHFDLRAERIVVNSIPQVVALVSGNVAVDAQEVLGREIVPMFTGDLQVHEAIITQEFGSSSVGSGVLASTDLPEWLADVSVDAPGNVWIKNTTVDMELEGQVQVVRNTSGLSVNGIASIRRGNYSLYLERFEITRGELDFSRYPGFQPEMDIEARQGRPGNRIYVHLTGRPPDNLRWSLSSDRGETSDQLQQALFLSPENDPFNVTTTVIERIFQDLQFIESFHIDPANDSLATQDAAIVPFNVSAGKAISDRVFLVYTHGMNESDINQKVAVEIDIVRGLLLASSYTRRNIPDSSTNRSQNAFDIDLKFRYEY
jgi:autotransporter translocation and assembly factor TamB